MNTSEVLTCFAKISKCIPSSQFYCLPSDKLKELTITSYPFFLCVNLDESDKEGSHWVGIYIARRGAELEFFDSYGNSISSYISHFNDFARRNNLRVIESHQTLQGPGSYVCGHYVIMYMYFRLKGCGRRIFYAKFSNNLQKNDKIVFEFVKKFFIPSYQPNCNNFQICKNKKI